MKIPPPCFDSMEQFEQWREMSRVSGMWGPLETRHCQDCNLAYQNRMILEGRCENPNYRVEDHPLNRSPHGQAKKS